MRYIILGISIWNIITFFLMFADKKRAVRNEWRIPERVLIGCAFFFGAAGVLLGMRAFRHKTRHLKFQILIPVALLCNTAVIYFIGRYLLP